MQSNNKDVIDFCLFTVDLTTDSFIDKQSGFLSNGMYFTTKNPNARVVTDDVRLENLIKELYRFNDLTIVKEISDDNVVAHYYFEDAPTIWNPNCNLTISYNSIPKWCYQLEVWTDDTTIIIKLQTNDVNVVVNHLDYYFNIMFKPD